MKQLLILAALIKTTFFGFGQNTMYSFGSDISVSAQFAAQSPSGIHYDIFQVYNSFSHQFIEIIKTENNVQSEHKLISSNSNSSYYEIHDVLADSYGNLYILFINIESKLYLIKFDSELNILWTTALSETIVSQYYRHKLIFWGEDHLAVSISKSDGQELIKLNTNGQIIWANRYHGNSYKSPGFDICAIAEGAILTLKDGSSATIYRIDEAGNVVWSKAFHDEYRHPRYVFVKDGFIYQFGVGNSLYLLILDLEGNFVSDKLYSGDFSTFSHFNIVHYLDKYYFEITQIQGSTQYIELDENFNISDATAYHFYGWSAFYREANLVRSDGYLSLTYYDSTSTKLSISGLAENTCASKRPSPISSSGSNPNLSIADNNSTGNVLKMTLPIPVNSSETYSIISASNMSLFESCASNSLGEEISNIDDLFVYPNPTNHSLNWNNYFDIARLQILDIQGRVIATHDFPNGPISLVNLQQGQYFARFTSTNGYIKTISIQITRD
jgi:hypothetical protein